MEHRGILTAAFITAIFFRVGAQHANDTLLFSVALNSDSSSIYGCQWNDRVRTTLGGPVLMADNSLLLYSQHGYVLFSQDGKLQDSHSLFKTNKRARASGDPQLRLAYPLDSVTLLYYKETRGGGAPDVYMKRLRKGGLKKVAGNTYQIYRQIGTARLFNLASNSITDEMGRKEYLLPHLVGYTSLTNGKKWWSTEKFFSFTSPLILEGNGRYTSFFPGLKTDQQCEFQKHLVEPIGVFEMDNRWYYYGVHASLSDREDENYQTLVLCDQAGNLLYSNTLLKQEITDAVLQKNEESNTIFTVRRASKHVFVPAVDHRGIIYYGMIDFEHQRIDIYRRAFYLYNAASHTAGESGYDALFAEQDQLGYSPLILDCNSSAKRGVRSEMTRVTDGGIIELDGDDQVRDKFYAMVHRLGDQELKKRLSRIHPTLPQTVQKIQDSLTTVETGWCPYSVSLNHEERGKLGYIHYGLGDEVVCARVLAVTNTFEVYVRVDLVGWAEVIGFNIDGRYMNRFIFNNQNYRDRKDLVIVSLDRDIIERDFESRKGKPRYLKWGLTVASDVKARRKRDK